MTDAFKSNLIAKLSGNSTNTKTNKATAQPKAEWKNRLISSMGGYVHPVLVNGKEI